MSETASAPAASARAGWAYLLASQPSSSDFGQKRIEGFTRTLVAIDPAGTVARVTVPPGKIELLRRASDGNAYALSSGSKDSTVQMLRLAGGSVEPVGDVPGCRNSTPSAFDVRGDRLVVHCHRGLFERRGGGAWTTLDVPGEGVFPSVWISKTGTLWFGSTDGLYERKGEAWSKRVLPRPNVEPIDFFDGPDGVYVSVHSTGLLRVQGQELVQVWPRSTINPRILWASANGTTGELDDSGRSSVRLDTPASMGTAVKVKGTLSYRSSVDDRGRVWAVHEGRLTVADTRTGEVDLVPMGAYAELDYIEPQPIVVLDRGPQVPRPQAVRRTKRIEVHLAPGDKPAANVDVELCPNPFSPLSTDRSPCSGVAAALVQRTRTDANGNLAIDDVPMGTYYLYWKGVRDKRWQRDVFMVPLREGEVSNVGTISRTPTGS